MKKNLLIALGAFLAFIPLMLFIWYFFIPPKASVVMDGEVRDQYGDPVAGAHIHVLFPDGYDIKRDWWITTDNKGRFHFDSAPYKSNIVQFAAWNFQNDDGVYYSSKNGNEGTFLYRRRTGWEYEEYERIKGIHYVLRFKLNRNGGPENMIVTHYDIDGAVDDVKVAYLDVLSKKVYNEPCSSCDLKIQITGCNTDLVLDRESGNKSAVNIIISSPEGEVLYDKETKYASQEAPPIGYQQEAILKSGSDVNELNRGWVYYHDKVRNIYGRIDPHIYCPSEHNSKGWGFVNVTTNPRGTRNLSVQGRIDIYDSLTLPIKLPYKDKEFLDPDKVVVTEYSKSRTVTLEGKPGAAVNCISVMIGNETVPEAYVIASDIVDVKTDGSFIATVKNSSMYDLLYLHLNCQHTPPPCPPPKCDTEAVPLYKLKNRINK